MNLMRVLLLLAIAWLVYQLVLKSWLRTRRVQRRASRQLRAVRCAHCGVHVPVQDAVTRGGEFYCSADHAGLGPS
jgi:uncharacterized protein